MKKLLQYIFHGEPIFDSLVENRYAHEYTDSRTRDQIISEYNKRYRPLPNPISHPEKFDPLNPPIGWAYDPYYEIWIETK